MFASALPEKTEQAKCALKWAKNVKDISDILHIDYNLEKDD